MSGATLIAAAAIVLPPGVEVTVVVVGVVGVVGVLGVLLLLPPQPTANTKARIKITKPILRTFPPSPYFLGINIL
jgi:hypothetical protein